MNELLPEKFAPTNSAVEVAVSPAQVVPTDDETTAAMRRMGGVEVGEYELRDLATVGAHVRRAGVLRISRGKAMLIQQMLKNVMGTLVEEIMELKKKPKKTRSDHASIERHSHTLGYLSSQLTDSQRLLIEIEKMSPPCENDGSDIYRNRPFAPGQKIIPVPPMPASGNTLVMAREVHMHNGGQPTDVKPAA